MPIFDGHNDTLLSLHLPNRSEGRDFFARNELGHLDLPRARDGGFGGGFFACYVPNPEDERTEESALIPTESGYEVADAPPLDPTYARGFAEKLAQMLFGIESESGGQLRVIRTAEELQSCLGYGVLAAVTHFEGAENLGPDPEALGKPTTRRGYVRSAWCAAGPTPTLTGSPSGSRPPRTRAPD